MKEKGKKHFVSWFAAAAAAATSCMLRLASLRRRTRKGCARPIVVWAQPYLGRWVCACASYAHTVVVSVHRVCSFRQIHRNLCDRTFMPQN